MKKIEFTEENKETFDVLYESVIVAPIKGIEEILKVSVIVEKMKSMGKIKEEKDGFKVYELKEVPTVLELEDDHFKYVKKTFEETQWASSLKIDLLSNAIKLLKSVESS